MCGLQDMLSTCDYLYMGHLQMSEGWTPGNTLLSCHPPSMEAASWRGAHREEHCALGEKLSGVQEEEGVQEVCPMHPVCPLV